VFDNTHCRFPLLVAMETLWGKATKPGVQRRGESEGERERYREVEKNTKKKREREGVREDVVMVE